MSSVDRTHVLMDARKVLDYGIGTYIQQLAAGIAEMRPDWKCTALTDGSDESAEALPAAWKMKPVTYGKYGLREFMSLGSLIRQIRPMVYHAPHFTVPYRSEVPTIVTIHDVIPLLFPRIFNVAKRTYARGMLSHAVRRSDAILTTSERTKEDLMARFRSGSDRIKVIPLGVSERYFLGNAREERADAFRAKYRISGRYVLFVGNIKPHKGLESLLNAMVAVRNDIADVSLVVVGGDARSLNATYPGFASTTGNQSMTRALGRIPEDDLPGAYAGASVFVLPSHYEGFGLPVLEAMATGTPVVSTDGGALPEVVGDAATIIPVGDAAALAAAITSLCTDERGASAYIAKGLMHARSYTWKRTAGETIAAYEALMAAGRWV